MIRIALQSHLIALKDTKIFLANRFAVGFAFLFPFLFIVSFTFALRGVGPDDGQLALVIATEDEGPVARQIIDEMLSQPDGPFREMSYAEASESLDTESIPGFIAFPSGFSSSVASGERASILVTALSDRPEEAAALHGVAGSVAEMVNLQIVMARSLALLSEETGIRPNDLEASDAGRLSDSVSVEFEQVGDIQPFNPGNFTVPGYLVMFIFFAAALGAVELVRERENHTLERLVAQGVYTQALIAGKFLASMYRGIMQLAVLWIVGVFAFGIDLGPSPLAVMGISFLMAVASSAFAIMLATLVKTRKGVDSAAVLGSLILAPLGGSWWPLFIMPEWMQNLGRLTPHGWANQAFNKLMLFGATAGDVVWEMVSLSLFGLAFIAICLWRFRTEAR